MVSLCSSYGSYCNSNPHFYGFSKCSFPLFETPKKPLRSSSNPKITCLQLGIEDIAGIAQNKVLIAAGVSAAVGQLSKPFTNVLLYGKHFDFRVAFQAGGFPSTHSSAVVASATCLALERGFSDSIVGLTVVYASLVMYDAQGVRREVGNHARLLNKLATKKQLNSRDDSQMANSSSTRDGEMGQLLSEEGRSYVNELPNSSPFLVKPEKRTQMPSPSVDAKDELDGFKPLKESIGHTEVEVIAGALLGFFVSLAVYAIL